MQAMKFETRHIKYAFADVVNFTVDRTIEAQVEIVEALSNAFKQATTAYETIMLPTGDGICAGIIEPNAPADAHLKVALEVLKSMHEWSEKSSGARKCKVRFGINEGVDSIITDVNGRPNIAGAGINRTQRLMNVGDGNQIIVGGPARETLEVRDAYVGSFRELRTEVKHGDVVTVFQYIREGLEYLDCDYPHSIGLKDPIDLNLSAELAKPENHSTSGMVQCVLDARDSWQEEVEVLVDQLRVELPHNLIDRFMRNQLAWQQWNVQENDWLTRLHQRVRGTMYRVSAASVRYELVKERAERLRRYRSEWVGCFEPDLVESIDDQEA